MRAARKPVASLVAGVELSLAMLPARALDVDRIEPLSRHGEPLLA